MGNPIVKLAGQYLIWSTISDAPASYGMTLDELKAHIREEHGLAGLDSLRSRLGRIEAKGTSSYDDTNADDTIWLNRAGPRETSLHREEIIEFFIRRKKAPTPKDLAAFRKGLPRCGPKCPSIERDGGADFCPRCWGTDFVRPTESERKPEGT